MFGTRIQAWETQRKTHAKNLLKSSLGQGIRKSTLAKHSCAPQTTEQIAENMSSQSLHTGENSQRRESAGTGDGGFRNNKPGGVGTVRW